MIDIEQVRKHPDLFRAAIKNKGVPLSLDRLLQVDEDRRSIKSQVDKLRQERNKISDAIAKASHDKENLLTEARLLGEQLTGKEEQLQTVESEFSQLIAFVPGLPCPGVPEGQSDDDNVELRRWGRSAKKVLPPKGSH